VTDPEHDYDHLASEHRHAVAEIERLRAANVRLRTAIQRVLNDEETGAGGWGPDVTMMFVLRDALDGT